MGRWKAWRAWGRICFSAPPPLPICVLEMRVTTVFQTIHAVPFPLNSGPLTPCSRPNLALRWSHRGTSLIRDIPLLGPYTRTIHRVRWWF